MCEIVELGILVLLFMAAVTDFRTREIPCYVLIAMSAVVLLGLACDAWSLSFGTLGGSLIGILFFLISKITNQAIGYGDSWIILVFGIYLGGFLLLHVLLWASLAACVCALAHRVRFRWRQNLTIPFVPFLTAAYFGVVIL